MIARADDSANIRIDRTIPLWGLITLAGMLFGNGVILWSGQREQGIKFDNLSNTVSNAVSEVKAQNVSGQALQANVTKIEATYADLSRRVLRLEAAGDAAGKK